MAKNKKKSTKHRSFFKVIKPIIRDNRVLYSILGALGAGLAIGAALGTDKGGMLVDKITAAVKEIVPPQPEAIKKVKPAKLAKTLKPVKINKFNKPNTLGTA